LHEASIDHRFLHLEFGNSVAKETTWSFRSLNDDDVVTSPRQLLGSSETSRPRTNHRDALPRWRCDDRVHPSFGERVLSNLKLNSLNGDWILIDPEDTRTFTRSGTQSSRELWEIVRGVEAICSC
jgi:hypothetical protein